jgi:hypothetical protein
MMGEEDEEWGCTVAAHPHQPVQIEIPPALRPEAALLILGILICAFFLTIWNKK